jgi:hypothetical protein
MKVYELIARLQAMPPMAETEVSFYIPSPFSIKDGEHAGVVTEITGKVDLYGQYYVIIKGETY